MRLLIMPRVYLRLMIVPCIFWKTLAVDQHRRCLPFFWSCAWYLSPKASSKRSPSFCEVSCAISWSAKCTLISCWITSAAFGAASNLFFILCTDSTAATRSEVLCLTIQRRSCGTLGIVTVVFLTRSCVRT